MEKKKRRITIRSSKNKGKRLQAWVCEKISEITGIPFNNQDDSCEIHSRDMGLNGVDCVLRGEAKILFPFDVETKNTETFNCYAAIEQAKANNESDRDWMVVHKKNGSKPIVVIDAEVFFNIYKEIIDARSNSM